MDEDDDRYDHELVRFIFDLRTEDPLRMLIRAQAHIEQSLRQFVLANAPSPRHVGREELDFEGVVRLALILGLKGDLKPALNALGTLQRNFSRSVDAEFGTQEADNFYNVLSPTLKEIMREVYQEVRVEQNLGEFKRLPPATRLVWFLVAIWSGILTDRHHGPPPDSRRLNLPSGYFEEVKERRSAFMRLMDSSDDFQLVIKGHSHLDRGLREFVSAAATQPAAIKASDYDYAGTLRLALTLGLDDSLEAGLSAVGSLRNKFAHRLDLELTLEEAQPIFDRLDPVRRADAVKAWTTTYRAWASTYKEFPGRDRSETLLDAPPRDIVATTMAVLYIGVLLQQLKRQRTSLEQRGSLD